MKLKSTDKLEVKNHCLKVNGKPFVVEYPTEPLCCIEEGKLVTLTIWGCGCALRYWDAEEIEGDFAA